MTERRSEATWNESRQMWVLRVQKDGERKAFYSTTRGIKGRREVEAKADKWLSVGTAEMRFSAAWERYLQHVKASTGTGNYKNVEKNGRLYILPLLKIKKLNKITRSDWQDCINEMAGRELSERTCKNVISTITAFLSFCDGENWEFNPIKKALTIPSGAAPIKEKRVLQPPALKVLFSDPSCPWDGGIAPAWYIYAWRFYVATGLRRGELAGLRREDVGGAALHIRRSINNLREVTHGKNENARRTVALSKVAAGILRDQQAMLAEHGVCSEWVFPDRHGECSHPAAIAKYWRKYCAYHGISCTVHELRHTFVSINKIDMPLELLKATVGHSVDMDTIGVYGHEIDGEKERAAQYIDEALSKFLD